MIQITENDAAAYAAGQVSLRKLAPKYGVSHETIRAQMMRREVFPPHPKHPMSATERTKAYLDRQAIIREYAVSCVACGYDHQDAPEKPPALAVGNR